MSLKEVELTLRNIKAAKDSAFVARYTGGVGHEKRKADEQSRLQFLGLSLPQVREAFKRGFSFSTLPDVEQAKIWDEIWAQSKIYDVKTLPLIWYSQKNRSSHFVKNWSRYAKWVKEVDNWAHSDGLSYIYAQALEQDPGILKTLTRWNKSKNPWERRQSVVSLFYYAHMRKKLPPIKTCLKLVENLLEDKHYYVQKGVGWTLREIYNVAPQKQIQFVTKNIKRIHPAAWYATSEKWPASTKKKMLKLRKSL